MWRLTEDEYKALQAKGQASSAGKLSKRKPDPNSGVKGQAKTQSKRKGKSKASYRIVVIARRKRDLDPDNLFPKWIIDQLVEAGILPDDSSKYVYSVEKRVERNKNEETLIEVWEECINGKQRS